MLSQTVVNVVDTAMVGRLSAAALAAVGLGATATWLSVSLLLAIGSATQVLVAHRMGQGRPAEAGRILDNSLLMGGASGLVAGIVIYLLTPSIMGLLASDAEVERLGSGYLQMRTIGFPFVVLNFAFRGFYHGIGDTRTYLKAIALTNAVNVVLDLLLIFGLAGFPRMEARGAGLATALALASGTLYYALLASRRTGVRKRFGAFRGENLGPKVRREVLSILLPGGLNSLSTALGFMVFYWMLAKLGTIAVAVNNVLMNVASVFFLPALGVGLAAATLVGQSLGRREPAEAEAWGWETVRLAAYALAALGLLLVAFPGLVFRAFTDDPTVLSQGRLAMQVLGASQVATGITLVLSNVLVSAGRARWVAGATWTITYLGILPAVYVGCVVLGGGVALAWVFQGLGRLGLAVAFMLCFRAGRWKATRL